MERYQWWYIVFIAVLIFLNLQPDPIKQTNEPIKDKIKRLTEEITLNKDNLTVILTLIFQLTKQWLDIKDSIILDPVVYNTTKYYRYLDLNLKGNLYPFYL